LRQAFEMLDTIGKKLPQELFQSLVGTKTINTVVDAVQ